MGEPHERPKPNLHAERLKRREEERKADGELATGGIGNPQPWRLVGEPGPPGFYIPQNAKRHSVELLIKTARAMGFGGDNGDK